MSDEDEVDEPLSPQDRSLINLICSAVRNGVVDNLMAGNDTQCFTTEQYHEAYLKSTSDGDFVARYFTLETARMHLRTNRRVREVKPGIWTWVEELRKGEA